MQRTIVAVYRGRTFSDVHIVAATDDPVIVRGVVRLLLEGVPTASDPAMDALEQGRRAALQRILEEQRAELDEEGAL